MQGDIICSMGHAGTAAGASPGVMHAFSVPSKPQSAPAASDEIGAAAKDGEGSSPGSSASDNEQGVFMSLAEGWQAKGVFKACVQYKSWSCEEIGGLASA